MKKNSISLLALTMLAMTAFSACDTIEDSTGLPVENPQQPVFNAEGITYIPVAGINAVDPAAGNLDMGSLSVADFPEGYQLSASIELSPYEDFSKTMTIPMTVADGHVYASAGDLAAQYTDKFTKNPAPVQLFGRTTLTASLDSETVTIGTPGSYFGLGAKYDFTPAAPSKIIDSKYYIVMGDGKNWDWTAAVAFGHSDVNQYDDPLFTAIVSQTSTKGDKWIVIGAPAYEKALGGATDCACFEPVYDRTASGVIYGDFEATTVAGVDAASLPSLAAPCEVQFNAFQETYSQKVAIEKYYATGDGWSGWGSHWMPLSTTNYTEYYGFLNIASQFKFSPTAGWNGDFGAAAAPSQSVEAGGAVFTGVCHDSGDNIQVSIPGLYFSCLNVSDWTYTLKETASWGLIGDFNGWGGDVEMTPSSDLYTWTAELTVGEGQGWKFRANHEWAINLGGTSGALWTNGDNIVLPAGTYDVTLDLTSYPATFTAVKK